MDKRLVVAPDEPQDCGSKVTLARAEKHAVCVERAHVDKLDFSTTRAAVGFNIELGDEEIPTNDDDHFGS